MLLSNDQPSVLRPSKDFLIDPWWEMRGALMVPQRDETLKKVSSALMVSQRDAALKKVSVGLMVSQRLHFHEHSRSCRPCGKQIKQIKQTNKQTKNETNKQNKTKQNKETIKETNVWIVLPDE